MKKRIVGGAILFIWIAMPAFETTMASLSTDIIRGTCVPWGVYSSYAMEKTVTSLIILVTFLLPLIWIVVSYSRIVYVLRNKVTRKHKLKHRQIAIKLISPGAVCNPMSPNFDSLSL